MFTIVENTTVAAPITINSIYNITIAEGSTLADVNASAFNALVRITENMTMADGTTVIGWFTIDDSQDASWQNINDAQSVTWNLVDDSETITWTPITTG